MNQALRKIAQDISQSLVTEMNGCREVAPRPNSPNIVELLLQRVTEEVVQQLGATSLPVGQTYQEFETRLGMVERKLQKLTAGATGDPVDEPPQAAKSFPNLKYAKPKYRNVESLMNYVERDQDRGGVKLVIMNFND